MADVLFARLHLHSNMFLIHFKIYAGQSMHLLWKSSFLDVSYITVNFRKGNTYNTYNIIQGHDIWKCLILWNATLSQVASTMEMSQSTGSWCWWWSWCIQYVVQESTADQTQQQESVDFWHTRGTNHWPRQTTQQPLPPELSSEEVVELTILHLISKFLCPWAFLFTGLFHLGIRNTENIFYHQTK